MSSNIQDAYFTNEMINIKNNYDLEKELCEIETEQQFFSEQYYEILGYRIEAREEKSNKDQEIKKIRFSCRKTSKSIKKVINLKSNTNQGIALSILAQDSLKIDDMKNELIEVQNLKKNKGGWHNERLEAQEEHPAIFQQENSFQLENLLLQGKNDTIIAIKSVDQSINQNTCQLNKNKKLFSSSLSNFVSD
ncbi:unnamed protein product [Paramecium sonneborni]|uniref:Uncharacterized protein n=1 Tax=Paramecium sonneborni TaxID=65129 RepID=A0A8S1R2J4_9CILI|nr:unnamed protein product [Paramecium sonneborni]